MMAMVSLAFGIICLLAVLSSGVLLVCLLLAALFSQKPSVALAIGSAVVLGLMAASGLMFAVTMLVGNTHAGLFGELPVWALPIVRGLALLALLGIAFAMVRKSPSGNFHGRWALLLLPVLVVLGILTTIRVERVHRMPIEQQAAQRVANQRAELARRAARIQAEVQGKLAKMDIHTLMDRIDAPKIALPPDPPAAPEPQESIVAIGESSDEPVQSSESADESQSAKAGEESQASDVSVRELGDDEKNESNEGAAADDAAAQDDGVPLESETKDPADSESTQADEEKAVDDQENERDSADDLDDEVERVLIRPVNEKNVAPTRPAWVDASSKRIGSTWRNLVVTDEFATREECDRDADWRLYQATFDHLETIDGGVPAGNNSEIWNGDPAENERWKVRYLQSVGITIDYIRREIARDEYLETVERSFGPMMKLYTSIEFTPTIDRELRARVDAHRRQERFAVVGGGAASVLALLGMAWGLLRVDTITKGYYSKWLFIGVPAAIIPLIALLALMMS